MRIEESIKRISTELRCFLLIGVALSFSSCTMSDAETEKKLEGVWTYSSTEIEDGVKMTMTAIETYSLPDHKFKTNITFEIGYPVNMSLGTVTYSGEWSASKDAILNKIDEKSVVFTFNKSLLDSRDRREFKEEMLEELRKDGYEEGVRIKSEIGDSFEAVDDDGERYTYRRLN